MDIKQNLRSRIESERPEPFPVTVHCCVQAASLTPAAMEEFERLDKKPIVYGGVPITLAYHLVLLEHLLEAKWDQTNTKWRNKQNQKREKFDFDVCGTLIRDSSKSCVFFTRASQLVDAYNEIGYQIFEANVRCEIKNSPVNKAIKASLMWRRGREEFKHLNNGITIICDGFQHLGPREEPTGLRIQHPGIINGLQTIKTLADFVSEHLVQEDFLHFQENCLILARVHTQNSVGNFRDLVKSTNNQNPMKPRNLRSNETAQLLLERYFAEKLEWFYERKEGAWNAFRADHVRWTTINRTPQHFMKGRVKKVVDNEEVAQAWLAFIGYSEQAVNEKRYLFAEDRDYYELIFAHRTLYHGRRYNHRIAGSRLIEDAASKAPTGEGMLVAYLAREFAKSVVDTRKENREKAVARLDLGNLERPKQETELEKDAQYLKGLVLRGMLLLFVEFFGYLMFSAFGNEVHERLEKLLANGTLGEVAKGGDFTVAKERVNGRYRSDDVLIHVWELYNHCVSQMIAGAWRRERQQAANISKFTYSEKTRDPLYSELREVGRIIEREMLTRTWTVAFNEAGSVENYLKSVLE